MIKAAGTILRSRLPSGSNVLFLLKCISFFMHYKKVALNNLWILLGIKEKEKINKGYNVHYTLAKTLRSNLSLRITIMTAETRYATPANILYVKNGCTSTPV